jgi:hypothetical protein
MTEEPKKIAKTVQSDDVPSDFSTPGGMESGKRQSTRQLIRDTSRMNALMNTYTGSDGRGEPLQENYVALRNRAAEAERADAVTSPLPDYIDPNTIPVVRTKPRSESP